MIKRLQFYAVSLVVLGSLGAAVYLYLFGSPRAGTRTIVDPPAVVRQIQQLRQLVTVKYSLQKMIGLEERKVPFGSESLLLMVQAEVLGGVDLDKLEPADVTVHADRSVVIRLPAPEILHVVINEKETRVWDRQKTVWLVWVPFNPELDQQARRLAGESMRAAAVEQGILRAAQENAETAVRELLRLAGMEPVTFAAH